jgi:hypothetical protein
MKWILLIVFLIIFSDVSLSFTFKKNKHSLKYNGLLWVTLDYWSIWKYNSNDKPMKWVEYKKTQTDNLKTNESTGIR